MKKKRTVPDQQLPLFDSEETPAKLSPDQDNDLQIQLPPEVTTPESTIWSQALDPASLTYYSRDTLVYQGPHDQARRSWLAQWAQQRGYKNFWFIMHHKYSGYYQTGVPEGEEGWTHFLERAVQYDIYCCYIAAYAPGQLEHVLKDAEKRGEIKNLDDHLIWRPTDNGRPR
jgi:hypothetical protein